MPVDNKRIAGPEITQPVVLREEKRLRKPLISSEGQRQDGRKADELRPMFLRSGVVSQARGSAYIEMQRTKVTCAKLRYGPRESSRQQEFRQKDSEEKEFSSFVVQALEPAVCLVRLIFLLVFVV
ncbi:unnamed protein product [Porites lobata]|uniref:Exoribonuclease phosphorolytic domain-containing protein n=1 Tax=Porites lobata TaxID=104759 RepID=A0ABN8SE75_9CNID|nr:unnamed protein product [Porites lobata]